MENIHTEAAEIQDRIAKLRKALPEIEGVEYHSLKFDCDSKNRCILFVNPKGSKIAIRCALGDNLAETLEMANKISVEMRENSAKENAEKINQSIELLKGEGYSVTRP